MKCSAQHKYSIMLIIVLFFRHLIISSQQSCGEVGGGMLYNANLNIRKPDLEVVIDLPKVTKVAKF